MWTEVAKRRIRESKLTLPRISVPPPAMVVGVPPSIRPEDLPILEARNGNSAVDQSLADVERNHIARVLESHDWNITRAAETLSIDRATLYNKIKKYDLRS